MEIIGARPAFGHRRSSRGFSLLELMIVITIGAILLGMGVPAFTELVAKASVRSAAENLQTSMLLARSEAVKRNANVVVSRTGSAWNEGWNVVAADGTVLQVEQAHPAVSITGTASTFTYESSGRMPRAGSAVSFEVASASGNSCWTGCIQVELTGRPFMQMKDGASC